MFYSSGNFNIKNVDFLLPDLTWIQVNFFSQKRFYSRTSSEWRPSISQTLSLKRFPKCSPSFSPKTRPSSNWTASGSTPRTNSTRACSSKRSTPIMRAYWAPARATRVSWVSKAVPAKCRSTQWILFFVCCLGFCRMRSPSKTWITTWALFTCKLTAKRKLITFFHFIF